MATVTRYEFTFTTIADGNVTGFSVVAMPAIDDNVAKGIRSGLSRVSTITNVTARRIFEDGTDIGS